MKTLHHSLVLLLSCGLWGLQAPAWAHGEQPNQVKILQERLPSNAPGKKPSCSPSVMHRDRPRRPISTLARLWPMYSRGGGFQAQ